MGEAVHAKIRNPLNLRRIMLESAISSVGILKSYDVVKKLRQEKKTLEAELKKTLDEIDQDVAFLMSKQLPAIKGFKAEQKVKIEKLETEETMSEKPAHHKKVPMNKLDAEMESIRAKLGAI